MMQYKESLLWILDKDCKTYGVGSIAYVKQEALYQRNIDFVHSLGLKCDCEIWPTLAQFVADALQS